MLVHAIRAFDFSIRWPCYAHPDPKDLRPFLLNERIEACAGYALVFGSAGALTYVTRSLKPARRLIVSTIRIVLLWAIGWVLAWLDPVESSSGMLTNIQTPDANGMFVRARGSGHEADEYRSRSTRSFMEACIHEVMWVRPPNVLGVSCTAGPAWLGYSGAAVAANDVRRTEWRPATAVTPSR
jgi:hypothetical protein